MAEANNDQMQNYANTGLRPLAEIAIEFVDRCAQLKSLIGDIYSRAVGSSRWNDAHTGGPPHLLQSGNSASPDDMLNLNAFVTHILWLFNNDFGGDVPTSGSTAVAFATEIRAQFATLRLASVRLNS